MNDDHPAPFGISRGAMGKTAITASLPPVDGTKGVMVDVDPPKPVERPGPEQVEILAALPEREHAGFLAKYHAAAREAAKDG